MGDFAGRIEVLQHGGEMAEPLIPRSSTLSALPNIPAVSGEYKRPINGLPDCLNHERFITQGMAKGPVRRRNIGVGMMRMVSKWMFAAVAAQILVGGGAAQAQQTIRVGWTIPAEESKYWMMRRPQEFPDLGKTYNIEWTQFQGTAPMTQALAAGALDCATQAPLSLANGVVGGNLKAYIVAQHVFEKPGGFSVYWAVMDNSPIKTIADLKGKTVGISVIGGGTQGPFNLLLKQNGVDPAKDIKLVEVGFAVSEDALRQGRVDAVNMNQPFAARAEAKGGTRKLFSLNQVMPNIVHILEACRADFVDKNPDLVKAYVRDITSGMKKALANREETLKVVSEVLKAPIPVLDTYLLKDNDFGRDPGAAPNFPAIQKMLDIYAETGMLPKLDVAQFKHPTIVAPLQ
jgi:ABC-type nitrate/sulfonate/bicarbonate transport system substrate-binding protein